MTNYNIMSFADGYFRTFSRLSKGMFYHFFALRQKRLRDNIFTKAEH